MSREVLANFTMSKEHGSACCSALVVLHQAHSTPGKVGECLKRRGLKLDRCCPSIGDSLPEDLSGYSAAVIFGGPQSANDDADPAIRAELDWLERVALKSPIPILGICLGAQQIARVLGSRVGPHPDGRVEIGYWCVSPTEMGRDFLSEPTVFYQWHSETFDVPRCAQHLAHNEAFSGQAFCYDEHVYAIEFHPEITREMVDRWCTSEKGREKLSLRGAQSHAEQLEGYDRYSPISDRWLNTFLDRYLLAGARRPD